MSPKLDARLKWVKNQRIYGFTFRLVRVVTKSVVDARVWPGISRHTVCGILWRYESTLLIFLPRITFHITSNVLNQSKFNRSGIYRTNMKIKQSYIFLSRAILVFRLMHCKPCDHNTWKPLEPGSFLAYWLCPRCKWPDHFLANSLNIWLNYEGWSKSNGTGFIAPFRKFLDKRWFALINWNLYAINMPSLNRKCSLNTKLWPYDQTNVAARHTTFWRYFPSYRNAPSHFGWRKFCNLL